MARAVGLTPERLETEGQRPDAAEILREIARYQEGNQPAEAAIADGPPRLRGPEGDFSGDDPEAVKPYRQAVRRDLYAILGILPRFGPRAGLPGGPDLPAPSELPDGGKLLEKMPGWLIFEKENEAKIWSERRLTLGEKEGLMARLRQLAAEIDSKERQSEKLA
jgi:hypothetical protein